MAKQTKRQFIAPQYKEELNKAVEFLSSFTDSSIINIDQRHGNRKYMIELQKIANRESKRIDILIEDLEHQFNDDTVFVNKIKTNTLSYQRLFYQAADQLMPTANRDVYDDTILFDEEINRQREMNLDTETTNPNKRLPSELTRKYTLYLIRGGHTKNELQSIRDLRAKQIGSLITMRAMVVRTSEVRPQITVACYSCDACGYENYQTVSSKTFAPLQDCASERCLENRVRGRLIFNSGSSKFIPFQEIKVQELKDQLPRGSIPRTFTVYARGEENIRQCSPGDVIQLQGVYLPNEKEGFFANKSQLYVAFIEAFHILREKKKYSELSLDGQAAMNIFEDYEKLPFSEQYEKLAKSIAPEIFGMLDIKKALLLQMVGGVTKEMHDGLKIRGDINIALIGDPGVAKSQLLRYIATVCPRGIYTTGKGSSSVGLTAAVMKDQITGEMTLEGGALVMADRGICCIDEFDKMNESDRTAIHEVMEQQTVSIAKAGITTTLNARTSILAAANPLYGRYQKKFSIHKNINLPAALLSRFDLIFILLDEPDKEADRRLADHIGYVHQNKDQPNKQSSERLYTQDELSTYIAMTLKYEPIVTSTVHQFIAEQYVEKRRQSYDKTNEGYAYTTPRTLLGIIRLSQSLAKLKFKQQVSQDDVTEAIRLMEVSQESVKYAQGNQESNQSKNKDFSAQLYDILKQQSQKAQSSSVDYDSFIRQARAKGFEKQQIEKFITTYSNLNQLFLHGDDNKKITLMD